MKRISHKTESKTVEEIGKEVQDFLKRNPMSTFKKRQLAKVLGYTSEHEYARFKQALRQLEEKGNVQQSGRRKFGSAQIMDTATGFLNLGRDNNIFFIPDGPARGSDSKVRYVVSSNGMGDAKSGDRVNVKVVGGKGKVVVVKVIDVLERDEKNVVGTVERVGSAFKLLLRDKNLPQSIDVSRKKLNGAKEGEKVLAKLSVDKYSGYSAEVLSVFGNAGDPNVEIVSIAAQFDLRKDFPADVLREA
ncbi:MAG: hypothetical protein ACLP05_07535, partial [Candidatus Kryptoniota bacterium]